MHVCFKLTVTTLHKVSQFLEVTAAYRYQHGSCCLSWRSRSNVARALPALPSDSQANGYTTGRIRHW